LDQDAQLPTKEGKANPWNHPFWVVDKKEWIEVKDLKVGDRVLLSDGKEVAISGIRSYNVDATKVYNFEVADNHTYFVGEDGVLVHNYAETPWDAFSMAMGFVALDEAYKERDGFGVVLAGTAIVADGAAFLLPVVPGGAGFLVKAGRTGKGLIKNAGEASGVVTQEARAALNGPYIRKLGNVNVTGLAKVEGKTLSIKGMEVWPSGATQRPKWEPLL
jgi:hypothetical protein